MYIIIIVFISFPASYPLVSYDNHNTLYILHMENVECNGTEDKLINCPYEEQHDSSSRHKDTAGVICTSITIIHANNFFSRGSAVITM